MKIRTKIFLIFLSISFILTTAGMASLLFFADNSLREAIDSRLEMAVHSKSLHVKDFVEHQVQTVEILIKDHHWEDLLLQLNGQNPPRGFSAEEFHEHSREVLKDNLHSEHYQFFVIDRAGDIVLSTKEQWVGENRSNADYFLNSKEKTFISGVYYEEEDNKFIYRVSSPIVDKKNGEYLGSFVSLVDMENLFSIVNLGLDLGETGEIYLVNQDGYMITPSKFKENSVLIQKIDNINLRECFEAEELANLKETETLHKEEHRLEVYSDYRGIPVLGAHSYIRDMGWCLISEVNEEEVFTPLDRLLFIFLVVGVVVLLFTSLASNWIGLTIGEPIERLRKSIKIVEKGNLDYNVELGTFDEIGELSRAFSVMIHTVKKSREDVEKRVTEQTGDIILKKENIEKQQSAILNILEDVEEEREKTNIEMEKVDTLLHSIGDGVFAIDEEMKIILFNEAAEKVSGFSSKEVVGKKYDDVLKFINEKDDSPADGFIKDVMTSETILEMPEGTLLLRKDGVRVPVADSAAPIKDISGNIVGCIIVFRDVTRKRKIEQMKSEFVSIASHQLRTPLTGIQWVSERLLKISGKLPEKERGYINDVYLSAKRLSRLVDDLLSVSRIEGGRVAITPEKINVVEFLGNYFQEIQPLAVQKNIKINLEKDKDSIEMITDRSALQNIYQSLISNAIEYTPEGGNVVVSLKKVGEKVMLKVSDTGIGIPEDDQPTIFEKFTRGSNAGTVKTDGTGFGLYIAKQTVDMLGGKIWFESEVDKGTTFFVELPIESKPIKGEKKLA